MILKVSWVGLWTLSCGLSQFHGHNSLARVWSGPYIQACKAIYVEIAFDWGRGHTWLHTTLKGPWPHYMTSEVSWVGLWTLSLGLSQCHGHGSWPSNTSLQSHIHIRNQWAWMKLVRFVGNYWQLQAPQHSFIYSALCVSKVLMCLGRSLWAMWIPYYHSRTEPSMMAWSRSRSFWFPAATEWLNYAWCRWGVRA